MNGTEIYEYRRIIEIVKEQQELIKEDGLSRWTKEHSELEAYHAILDVLDIRR